MQKKIIFLILLITVILSVGFVIFNKYSKPAEAGIGDNVYGWAWSENIGWISFNGTNYSGGADYGVHICMSDSDTNPLCLGESEGSIVGYAWSENIGWISFNSGDLTGCPIGFCEARYDSITDEVSGWARALAYGGGWDGWIKLRGVIPGEPPIEEPPPPVGMLNPNRGIWDDWIKLIGIAAVQGAIDDILDIPYGVWMDTSVSPAEFKGWAWGGDDTSEEAIVGWISFNCLDTGICETSDYKVMNNFNLDTNPVAINAKITEETYCNILPGIGYVGFGWDYYDEDGDPPSEYNLRIFTFTGEFTLVVDAFFPQNNVSGTSAVQVKESPTPEMTDLDIGYGAIYYWEVRVKDIDGNWSPFIGGDPVTFITPAHPYPWIDFSWMPEEPSAKELVQFTDESIVYGGANKDSWFWTFPFLDWEYVMKDEGPPPIYYGPGDENPLGKFLTSGEKDVFLTVADSDGFWCQNYKTVNSQLPLPEWKEIAPFETSPVI